MRALIVGDGERADRLAAGLERAGIEVERPGGAPPGEGGIAALAGGIVALERLLADRPANAVVLEGDSDAALAALIVASKLEVPVARVAGPRPRAGPTDLNWRLIASLADAELAEDAETVAAWVRGT
ncbi:MAG TPA: hypothetical protein VKG89_00360 [Solirubrobacterales bacterium]|nr:hypothetical protein [Solirubrobacterales bacterium]